MAAHGPQTSNKIDPMSLNCILGVISHIWIDSFVFLHFIGPKGSPFTKMAKKGKFRQ